MHPDLATLLAVHEEDQTLEKLHQSMKKAQRRLLAAESEVKAASQHLEDRQNAAKRTRLEELALQDKVRTYEHQRRMAIRALEQGAGSADAAERQIEQCDRILDEAETQILQLMEDQERITDEIEAAQSALTEVTEVLTEQERDVPTEIGSYRTEYQHHKTRRSEAFSKLEQDLQERYKKLRERRGTAVSLIKNKSCHRCGRVVQAQHLGDILGGKIMPCHGCARWLIPTP